MLLTLVVLLAATVIAVPISRRLGFGSILGYLVAGILIGPAGLRLVTDVEQIADVAELGVIMLLFLIGLELRPQRLWVLRKAVFGLGLGQMIPSTLALAGLVHLADVPWTGALVLGAGLSLSSTAIVLPMLAERELLSSAAGRDSFAVLLFQDLAFIPMVALVPLLVGDSVPRGIPWIEVARGIAAIAVILIGGRFLVRPLFRIVGGAKTPEVLTATALLMVIGTAALADWAGLSMSLGAFMAGVLLSESEYRHEIKADIEPFEGLLLGFFFTSVGMSTDVALAFGHPGFVALSVLLMVLVKVAIALALGLLRGATPRTALRFSLTLPEGSEFSFVLFGIAVLSGALTRDQANLATLVIATSMLVTPILFALSERFVMPRLERRREPIYDTIDTPDAAVIICGFGRVGQIVGRILRMQNIPFTALDEDVEQVEVVRRFGNKVYFGKPTREDVLRSAGAATAKVLVVALDDMEETLTVVTMAKRQFPNLAIFARARNRRHAHLLMDVGIAGIIRETFFSSLRLSEMVLAALNVPKQSAQRAIQIFQDLDERSLIETHAISQDEEQLIQSSQNAAAELTAIFEADQKEERKGKARGSAPGPRQEPAAPGPASLK